jgi:hypothetical protein
LSLRIAGEREALPSKAGCAKTIDSLRRLAEVELDLLPANT